MAIRVLPPDVAARIAAGEVVERPASIIKELVENALDAGATRISVEAVSGGIESIRVTDDGCGIEPDELETAFQRHATSKLEDGEDLSHILTLGFRGEALPSIAAVANVEIVSRPHDREAAACLRLAPGEPAERATRGAPAGTSVAVRNLFARQPARRKFLRSPAAEAGAAAAVVSHYALARSEVRFELSLDGRRTLATPGSGYLRDALGAVYGAETAAAMIEVGPDQGFVRVEGLAGPPQISRAGRGYISLFVNGRWIQNRRLAFAVEDAYAGMLMTGRRPLAVLNLRVPHDEVDVNVHPTKAEVRFQDESAVFGAVQKAVRRALLESAPVAQPLAWPGSPSASGGRTVDALVPTAQATTPLLWQHAVNLAARTPASVPTALAPAVAPAADSAATPAQALPVLRVIGQYGASYIIAEGPDGMYLIDQHAAHERVLYERVHGERSAGAPAVQALLEPLSLDVSPRHRLLLESEEEALHGHGFEIESFGSGALLLRAVPLALAGGELRDTLVRFLDLMSEEGEGDRRDRVAMSLACHGSVRAGQTLSFEEMRDLVRQLEESEAPHTCPHGRPTMIHMSAELLAREFGRR
ncbi:MAG: DNA mismatch repair endonuclease MutL [Chloroflexi bacterium]|nr:MAG: DNA mismatch repair endonuclease MutL [Chloroflexota bacterium]